MTEYVAGFCNPCREGHLFTNPAARDKWLNLHVGHVLPEPTDKWTQDAEAGAIG